ncbi:MAG: pilus assembly protein PilP [Azovibrio sp.]|uniref:pilus assembly protein PilP n=1 Tax=Azovibrio sp. TaxID=1872673 RepID=UPI003C782FD5
MRSSLYASAITLTLLLAGCGGGEHEDLQTWMAEASKDLRGKIPPLPQIKPYEPVPYTVENMVDPFSSSKIEPEKRGRRGAGQGSRFEPDFEAREARNSVMEKYPIESMKMIGFMNINNTPMAAIQVDQLVKQVKVGDYIGLDFGVVVKITDQAVEIKEVVEDSTGDWSERMNMLQLQAQEEIK